MTQEVYRPFLFAPLIDRVLKADWEQWQKQRKQRQEREAELVRAVWGEHVQMPRYISPSTASLCLRWVGYEALGLPPAQPPVEAMRVMDMGSSAHWGLLRKLGQHLPGRQEASFTIEEANLSGRLDFIFRNPATRRYQIVDLKFVGDYPFRQVKREKGAYQPSPEFRGQLLLYIWAKRQQGLDIACGNIVYISRNNGAMKEALVVWDALAEFDAEKLVTGIKEAKELIDKGELPEPTVESKYVCASLCPHRGRCEHGREFVAGQIRKVQKRRPLWVYKKAGEQADKIRKQMEEAGVVQPRMDGFA